MIPGGVDHYHETEMNILRCGELAWTATRTAFSLMSQKFFVVVCMTGILRRVRMPQEDYH